MTFIFELPNIDLAFSLIVPFKLALATLLGMSIGRERKQNEKPGGTRTFGLVCLGACLIAILSLELLKGNYTFDFARLLAYGIAGIGFLGSGVIIKNNNKVEGVTTASSLFILMPIGFCIGLGYYTIAIMTGAFVYLILESNKIKVKKRKKKNVNKT